jgi:SAM-dependent methyltransferase
VVPEVGGSSPLSHPSFGFCYIDKRSRTPLKGSHHLAPGSSFMSDNLQEWERIEAKRSASEASRVDENRLKATESQVLRYLDPPLDTWHELEYCYALLGDARGKTVLEYGCGDGRNTLLLALRGAKVKALDISPDLIDVARKRLEVNNIEGDVEFIVGSAHDVPLPDESVDIVFGMAILHHLDLELSAKEVKRVLKKGGRAIFNEPVRNSRIVKFARKLVPYQSPDISPYERPLTDKELGVFGEGFSSCSSRGFTFPTTEVLEKISLLPGKCRKISSRIDQGVMNVFPSLKHFAGKRVVEFIK